MAGMAQTSPRAQRWLQGETESPSLHDICFAVPFLLFCRKGQKVCTNSWIVCGTFLFSILSSSIDRIQANKEENKMPLEFHEFPKMPSSTKAMANLEEFEKEGSLVIFEKIHGANCALVTDGIEVKSARRRGFLHEDENFFPGAKMLLADHEICAINLFEDLRVFLGLDKVRIVQIIVYGEGFGGIFMDGDARITKESATVIQHEVLYHPENKFMVFDVLISTKTGTMFLEHTEVIHGIIERAGFLVQRPLTVASLTEALNFEICFQSRIAGEIFNLPPLHSVNNLAEGIVIKQKARTAIGQNRFALKRKNDKFVENWRGKETRHKKIPETQGSPHFEFLSSGNLRI